MIAATLIWNGPHLVSTYCFRGVPKQSGVYAFVEGAISVTAAAQQRRLLYIGKGSDLHTRLPGYKFRPYLEIVRRKGVARHVADRHKGRALLHAHQFFADAGLEPDLYLWWAPVGSPREVERVLISDLRPTLNSRG